MKTETVKSITTKELAGSPVTKAKIGQSLGAIKGVVTSVFAVNTKHGESHGFKGDFFAITHDKRVIYSEAVFLPRKATEDLMAQLREGENEISLDCEIKVVASEKNEKGFAYVCDQPETEERKARRAELMEKFASAHKLELTG